MNHRACALALLCAVTVSGCVSGERYRQTLGELAQARKASAQTSAAFEAFKQQAAAEAEQFRKHAADEIAALQQELSNARKAFEDATARLAVIEKEKEQATAALAQARDQARELETKLAAEQTKTDALQQDKQRLLAGTTTAQDEIARLQKRAGELETESARAKNLEKRLSERDREIGTLRQAAADRESLATKLSALTQEVEQSKQRVAALTSELAAVTAEAARVRTERDQTLQDLGKLQASLEQEQERLRAEAEEKARLEQDRAAKEAEIQRLTKTHEDLTRSLQAEIAKGDITIKQVRDRLTINMVDRVLFDSGQAKVKPAGLKVLKQVSEILKKVTDKQIRIEGHTDNVAIGAKLKDRIPTNWELSTARATSVVRYLIEEGGVNPANLSAVGYADTQPIASNETEAGRTANRRIEIVLYPKDLSEIAKKMKL